MVTPGREIRVLDITRLVQTDQPGQADLLEGSLNIAGPGAFLEAKGHGPELPGIRHQPARVVGLEDHGDP
jgi:hypothetical protein